ncbi:MAG: tetratricopeptide repeat protein [Burkholderiales bacterium]|jgi:hypothetical protein|nr:sel1 repeat family protein [Sulfuricella sp.]
MSLLDDFFAASQSPPDKDGAPYLNVLVTRDYTAAVPLLKTAIARDDARAMGFLAALYMLGHGVQKDPQESYLWFRQAANRGDLPSQTALGMCLAGGRGTRVDYNEAAFWLFRAGSAGYMMAIGMLGWLVDKHPSVVGAHFTEDQVCDLLLLYKKAAATERQRLIMDEVMVGGAQLH